MPWTWANLLTGLRLASIPPLLWCMNEGAWLWASLLFVGAALSDYFDGRLARRYNQASSIGGVIDHATDAIFVSLACFVAASLGFVPLVLSIVIIAAFVQYLLDSKALAGQQLKASQLGRYNGIAYFVIVGIITIGHGIGWWPWLAQLTYWLGWLLVATTAMSMASRAWGYFNLKSGRTPSS